MNSFWKNCKGLHLRGCKTKKTQHIQRQIDRAQGFELGVTWEKLHLIISIVRFSVFWRLSRNLSRRGILMLLLVKQFPIHRSASTGILMIYHANLFRRGIEMIQKAKPKIGDRVYLQLWSDFPLWGSWFIWNVCLIQVVWHIMRVSRCLVLTGLGMFPLSRRCCHCHFRKSKLCFSPNANHTTSIQIKSV